VNRNVVLVGFHAISIIIKCYVHSCMSYWIFLFCAQYFCCIFVICMTAACEGYENHEFYENCQEQTFELEDQQILINEVKCP
jgi:hypothetical protein